MSYESRELSQIENIYEEMVHSYLKITETEPGELDCYVESVLFECAKKKFEKMEK